MVSKHFENGGLSTPTRDAMTDGPLLKDRKLVALGAASLLSSAVMLALLFTDGGFR